MRRLAVFAMDDLRPAGAANLGHTAQRNLLARRRRQQNAAERVTVPAIGLGQSNGDLKPAAAIDDLRHRLAAHRGLHHVAHVRNIEPVTCQFVPVHDNLPLGRAGEDLLLRIGGAAHLPEHAQHLVGRVVEPLLVRAENLDCDVSLHAGNGLAQAHRHRLRKVEDDPGNLRQFRRHGFRQSFFGASRGPLVTRLQVHEHVTLVDTHRLGGEVGPAQHADYARHLGELQQRLSTSSPMSTDSDNEMLGSRSV